jgi:enterochelin esterase-like enzyme
VGGLAKRSGVPLVERLGRNPCGKPLTPKQLSVMCHGEVATKKACTSISASNTYSRVIKVGVGGLEPPAPASQTRCATNCATPRRLEYNRFASEPSSKWSFNSFQITMANSRMQSQSHNYYLLSIILGLGLILLPGCKVPVQPAQISTPTPELVSTLPQAPTLPVVEKNPDLPVIQCSETGQLKRDEIQSSLLSGTLAFAVYFPPCFNNGVQDNYPVLYLLHGQTYDDTQWSRMGITQAADRLIQNGRTVPFLIIMPNEEYYYRPVENNKFPEVLIKELLPWVEKNLNACPEKSCREIGGISRGAFWAIQIGLKYYDLFSSVGCHSLPSNEDDIKALPDLLAGLPIDQLPRIYLDLGRGDPAIKSAYQYELILNQHGIMHEWHLNEGHHDEDYWKAHVDEYLQWYTQPWQILASR